MRVRIERALVQWLTAKSMQSFHPFPSTSPLRKHSPPKNPQRGTTSSPTLSLTITLLIPRARARPAKLLRFAAAVVGHQQGAIVLDEGLLQLVLGVLVDVFLVVGDDGLGNGLADGVDLRRVAAAAHAHADVDPGELVQPEDEQRFVDLFGRKGWWEFLF